MIARHARRVLLLLLSLAMTGCAYFRPPPVVEVAADPVMYPAPSAGGRYIPWASGLSPCEMVFVRPFGRAAPSPRPASVP